MINVGADPAHLPHGSAGTGRAYGLFVALLLCAGDRKWADGGWLLQVVGLILAAWLEAVLWMTELSRTPGGTSEAHWVPFHTYRTILSEKEPEMFRSCFMNMTLFYPAGLLFDGLLP